MSRNPPWSDLHPELLSAIANFLSSNPIDILAFRAVCKSWNFSSPSPSPFILSIMLPLSVPCPAYCFEYAFFGHRLGVPVLSVTVVFAVRHSEKQESKSWLLFADQLTPGKIMIRKPFSNCSYRLPINFPGFLDVPNIHVDEIGRFYNLSFHPEVKTPPNVWSEYVLKVVLNSDESAAVALFHKGVLGLSRLRKYPIWGSFTWEQVHMYRGCDGEVERVDDVVSYKGKILSVDHVGRVYDVSCSDLKLRVIVRAIDGLGSKRKRLVESIGELYLVVRGGVGEESDGVEKFDVFKLNKNLTRWVRVSNLGGRVFFFGLDFSFSVAPQELGGSFGTNCIVYKEGSFRDYDGGVDDDIVLSSNLRSEDLQIGVWHMEDPCHIDVIGSYPGYSNVIWPPPAWLWPNDISKRLGDLEAALDDLLKNVPAEKLKTMSKELPEQVIVSGDIDNQRDASVNWKLAHRMKVRIDEAKDLHRHLESCKSDVLSPQQSCIAMNQQTDGASPFPDTEETCDTFLPGQAKLHGLILHLEEATTKLSNALKSQEQPSADAVV